jgi:hypothetical protein
MGVMGKKHFLRGGAAVVFVLGFAAQARAQNLLTNATFNSDVSAWVVGLNATSLWQPLDAGASPTSGSALVTNSSPEAARGTGIYQCRPATAGQAYDFGIKARIPSGQANTGLAAGTVAWFSSPTCAPAGLISNDSTPAITVFDRWQGASATNVTAPAGTVAGYFECRVSKDGAGGTFRAYCDDVFFAPADSLRATLTVAVAASIHGANQTFFHSDAWILNRSFTNTNVVTAVYRCFGGVGCGAAKTITLAPRESKLIADVIATLFGVPESGGAIELSWDTFNGPITAQTRLFTPSSPPSYGFGVPALPSSAAATRAVFVGVAGNPDITKGFRSNGGAYNPNAFPVTVTFTLTDGTTGAPIGTPFTRVWGPFEAAQVTNLVTSLGGTTATTNAVLVATATGGAVFFYVATVDNASGDSIYVTASVDEAPVP